MTNLTHRTLQGIGLFLEVVILILLLLDVQGRHWLVAVSLTLKIWLWWAERQTGSTPPRPDQDPPESVKA